MSENPMQLDGFEFVEFTTLEPEKLQRKFRDLGFIAIAKHKSKNVILYRQGKINFILNIDPDGHEHQFAKEHGESACAMGFRTKNAKAAHSLALSRGAKDFVSKINENELEIPAIEGIGGSVIYFIDRYEKETIYDTDFNFFTNEIDTTGMGLDIIDHLTHNVQRGHMNKWAKFYEELFNFREIRYFDIKGQHTGLISRAMTSPCNKIRIPINEASDEQSQIEEYLREFKGEGIQHIALSTNDIYQTVETMRKHGIQFLEVPDMYYEMIGDRVPWHLEDLARLQKNKILIDGTKTKKGGLLLQIFTQNMLGPVFFEIIQRKGNEGFGEGNFQALFEAIERDQIHRGVIKQSAKQEKKK